MTLGEEHLVYCDRIARQRHENAKLHSIKGNNGGPDASSGGPALAIDILGVRGECAAYLWLKPIKWHRYHEGLDFAGLPDLGNLVDVKTVGQPGRCLLLQPNAEIEWIYLVSGANHPEYEMQGWLWGDEAKRERYWRTIKGRSGYFVPVSALRPAPTLKEFLPREA